MIKVGQIWQDTEDGWRCVITLYSPVDVYYIWENGSIGHCSKTQDFLHNKSCIAEYPTWQEAVNSKEFKVGGK
jgi:hypothetical protein